MRTLIIYSSKHGTTEKCSKLLKEKLKGEVEVVNFKKSPVPDFPVFDNIIIGSSIYVGKIQREISEFCIKNLSELKEKNVGLFICCANKNSAEEQINNNFPKELLANATAKENFGGEFRLSDMNVFERFMVKMVTKADKTMPALSGKKDISMLLEKNINEFASIMNKFNKNK